MIGVTKIAKTILIVDDEADILNLVEDILTPEGYKIIKAKSGTDALKILKKIKPDLVLLDFFMPKMSGREVCEKIRADKRLKSIKVAFLTIAKLSKVGFKELNRMNVIDFRQKPFDNEDLIKRVKKIISG